VTIDPDILPIFLAEMDGYLTTLGRGKASVEERRRAAHGLKGAASMLGLEELRGSGLALEEALAEDDAARVREELGRTMRLVDALRPPGAAPAIAPERERSSPGGGFDDEWDPETASMLRRLFAEEAHDHLEAISGALSRMGRAPTRGELEEMLRKAHTLKGSASTVGLQRIGEAAHRFEETLIELRDGVREADEALLDRLLVAVDLLRSMVEAEGSDATTGELLERFTAALRELPAEPPGRELQPLGPLPGEAEPPLLPDQIDRRTGERRGSERRFEDQRVRVDVKKLDALMNAVGELVIDRTRVERRVEELRGLARDLSISRRALHTALSDLRGASEPAVLRLREVDTEVADAVVSLERATGALSEDSEALRKSTHALQDVISQVRMMPIHWLHARLQRPLRGMARSQGKLVELFIDDESSEMDRSTAEQITDSLLQLVRNAVAHGIEPPEERGLRGKPPVGRIRISARHQGDFVLIDVEDDGGGIDPAQLRRTLAEQQQLPAVALEALGDEDLLDQIFAPGFSTRARADRLAGRGVGLDLVRKNVSELGGNVQVRSRPGVGTRFTLQVPMTTAIAQALLFKVGEPVYALPVSHVVETVYADPAELREDPAIGHQVLTRRGWLPLLHLHDLLGGDSPLPLQRTRNPAVSQARQAVIVVQVGELCFGATCTRVIGPREIVLKPLGRLLSGLTLFAGATISGSSKVQFVLDAVTLSRLALGGARSPQLEAATIASEPGRILLADDSRAVREALAHILRGAGYSVDTAADGWEAWERLQLRAYDLLVTDLEMPGLHGYELLDRCRAATGLSAMPILVLTSRTAERNRQLALEHGASSFVAKPINRRVLLDQIKGLIRRGAREDLVE
jgi:chemotaxis protein histidine kinase CheA/ActR/RegA family two-component response regulator